MALRYGTVPRGAGPCSTGLCRVGLCSAGLCRAGLCGVGLCGAPSFDVLEAGDKVEGCSIGFRFGFAGSNQ